MTEICSFITKNITLTMSRAIAARTPRDSCLIPFLTLDRCMSIQSSQTICGIERG